MAKKLSKQEWEQKISEAGSGRYEFIRWAVDDKFGSNHKCVVRCVMDGFEWSSIVRNLVNNGYGCPQCSGVRRWTAEERIRQINEIKNIKFDSWVDGYNGKESKANVRCEIDGFVWAASVNHLVSNGRGCPQCAGKRRWTSEERISHINELKNIEFISWCGVYKNQKSKANVKCTVDGLEWSAAVYSLVSQGSGCPRCAKYGYQIDKKGYLYALRSECGQYLKIGISNNPTQRYGRLKLATPFKFNIVEQIRGDGSKIAELEKYFHSKYERAGFTGFSGCTEWLISNQQLLEELRNLGDK